MESVAVLDRATVGATRHTGPTGLVARLRLWVGIGLCIAGFGLYGWEAVHSPFLNSTLRDQQATLQRVLKTQSVNLDQERVLAEAYWTRNPDVAADPFFGRAGRMGLYGAREHYDRHGRREGRAWGT